MTVTQHGAPNTQYGPAGTVPAAPTAAPPGYDWHSTPPVRRGGKLMVAGIIVTALISLAALVVGIVALFTGHTAPVSAPAPVASQPPPVAPAATQAGDTTAADRALCTAIAPLMSESDQLNNNYVKLGDPGTPARDAATPKFITDTQDWIRRVQPIVDQNPNIDPFLHRSLQRFIDDLHLLVVDLTPGPLTSYAKVLFSDSVGAYSGPLHVCDGLGIKW